MSDILENSGNFICVGLGLLIYYSITFIQPELEKTKGISEVESDVIAAAICLSAVALISMASVAAGACIGGTPNYFYESAKVCGDSCYGFFNSADNHSDDSDGLNRVNARVF